MHRFHGATDELFGNEIVLNLQALLPIRCLPIVALIALSALADNAQRPGLPKPILTTKRLFTIPFYLNPNSRSTQRVVLFVSGDKGQSWTLYQRRTAQFSKFDFHAGEDGEYWFVVRTTNQSSPNAVTLPEKIVIVDQHKPEMDVAFEVSPEGVLQAQWTINDPNLNSKSFKLEYQLPDDNRWRPVTVSMPPSGTSTSYVGDVSWVPANADGRVSVRAKVLDEAGNAAVFEKSVRMHPIAAARSPFERGLADRKAGSAGADPPQLSSAAEAAAPTDLTYPQTIASSDIGASSKSSSDDTIDRMTLDAPSSIGWRTTASDRSTVSDMPSRDPRFDPPELGYDRLAPLAPPVDSVGRAPIGAGPVRGEYLPPVANQVSPDPSPSQLNLPTRQQIQMTNSPRFNLDYEVSDAGDSGVDRVELWITSDDGQTWKAYGADDDLTSPFLVELNREGIYGFRLLIRNGLGASADPPRPGDSADLWVGIDLTPPQTRITSARLGTGSQVGFLDIDFVATDQNLPDKPIRLSYAERLEGPWMPIAEPLPNSGFHRWRIPEKVTDWIYLKIDVSDQAGNKTSAQLPDPVSTIPVPPSGRIRSISPLGGRG